MHWREDILTWKAISSALSLKAYVEVCTIGVVRASLVFMRALRSPDRVGGRTRKINKSNSGDNRRPVAASVVGSAPA